ncbi:hypothetical protein NECAME_08222 [Necator americanus]|uniref:Uncharacterized protein n=1 Tax=Necator americanus TaxID=51031 RepID=W2TIT6_NECAM|nr:hypothetical protein NECAME_08222 [Necator americanus]ETN82015.1 hypothetical protein NECAME_08222 [Necator americanus]
MLALNKSPKKPTEEPEDEIAEDAFNAMDSVQNFAHHYGAPFLRISSTIRSWTMSGKRAH